MTLIAKRLEGDKPEVLLLFPDGRVEFAVTAQQLWEATYRAAKTPGRFTSHKEATAAADWLAERQGGLEQARRDAAERTRKAIEAYESTHGVTVCASRKVYSLGLQNTPRPKPTPKPKSVKVTLGDDLLEALKDLL